MIARHHDWITRLYAYVRENAARLYEPGVHDCALFAARGADRICVDSDYEQRALTVYARSQARRALVNGDGLEALASEIAGSEPVPRNWIRRGDAALVKLDDRQCLGQRVETHIVVAAPTGIVRFPLELAVCGWRIG